MVNGDLRSLLRRQDTKMVLIGFPLGFDSINDNENSIDFHYVFLQINCKTILDFSLFYLDIQGYNKLYLY